MIEHKYKFHLTQTSPLSNKHENQVCQITGTIEIFFEQNFKNIFSKFPKN